MRHSGRILVAFAVVLVTALVAAPGAAALSNRVFVSTTGDDGNDCSDPLNPCRYIARALTQVATRGEVIALASGGYGAINITKSVTISGPPGVVIFSNFPVNVSTGLAATVVLRGLTIDGTGATTGSGINVTSVGWLHVENCVITGFLGFGGPNGNGIFFNSPGQLFVKDTVVRANGSGGIYVFPTAPGAFASIDHCRTEQNYQGVVADATGGGFAIVTVRDSVASGNSADGFAAIFGELNVENCLSANNIGTGVSSQVAGAIVRVSNSTITDNGTGISAGASTSILSRSDNTVRGNTTKGAFTGTFSAD